MNWPDFTFPPVNLWCYPKQYEDYRMSTTEDTTLGSHTINTKVKWKPKIDIISSPPHYMHGGFQTWDVIDVWKLNYNLGNVVKYVSRCGHKGKRLEDLQKARAYLNREIDRLEDEYAQTS
jgi:hypothetical protein